MTLWTDFADVEGFLTSDEDLFCGIFLTLFSLFFGDYISNKIPQAMEATDSGTKSVPISVYIVFLSRCFV